MREKVVAVITHPYRSLWDRWDATADVIHVYDYCQFGYPIEEVADPPWGKSADGPSYLQGFPRLLLRHTPVVATVYLFLEIGVYALGHGDVLWPVYPAMSLLAAAVIAAAGSDFVKERSPMAVRARAISDGLKALAILLFLSLAGFFIVLHVLTSTGYIAGPQPGAVDIVNAEYAVLLFIGGYLVYDGMLRTESLVWSLADSDRYRISDPGGEYPAMRRTLASFLQWYRPPLWGGRGPPEADDGVTVVRYRILQGTGLMAAVVTVLFWAADVLNAVDGRLWYDVFVVLDAALLYLTRFLILIVAINFTVLVGFVWVLADRTNGKPTLRYHPFHPDELGGFRDMGKFATRVNVLLVLGGLYAVYRIVVFDITDVLYGFGPIVLYAAIAAAWFYFSFWRLHRAMVAGIREWLAAGGAPDGTPAVGGFSDNPTWEDLVDAPRWPVSYGQLTQLVSANLLPVVLAMIRLFFLIS